MITGINLTLTPPNITWKSDKLKICPEIESLMHSLVTFFEQENTIYDADLTLSNCEYKEVQGDFGKYKQRIDYTFPLRFLEGVTLYKDYIIFQVLDNDNEEEIKVNVGKDFFYFLEWENEYYR